MVEFLRRAGNQPVNIHLHSPAIAHVSAPGARERRIALVKENLFRARILHSGMHGELKMLDGQSCPALEVLQLFSHTDMTVDAPNLREVTLNGDGRLTLLAPNLSRARCLSPATFPDHQAHSLRVLELKWPAAICAQLPFKLTKLASLETLVIEVTGRHVSLENIDTEHTVYDHDHDILNLQSRGVCLSLPNLSELRISGKGAVHRIMCALLAHLVATSSSTGSLRRVEVDCDNDPNLINSSFALDALKAFAHVIQADALYLHFEDSQGGGGVSVVISTSRLEHRHDSHSCLYFTLKCFIPCNWQQGPHIDALVKVRLMSLLPLGHITNLFIERLPELEVTLVAQIAMNAALSQLTSVHTLHVSENGGFLTLGTFSIASDRSYALVGPPQEQHLPLLATLFVSHIHYVSGWHWWKRLALALTARLRAGVPFTTLHISCRGGVDLLPSQIATLSVLETFHEQPGVDLQEPDIFITNIIRQASKTQESKTDVGSTSAKAKDRIESAAKSLFSGVVEKIEVEEASPWLKPVWPAKYPLKEETHRTCSLVAPKASVTFD
ncbi:hypothetical protein PENSPDRAFT_753117 [Peniophora sp. CONT]|nr:hypothetical protein PENSPDRAFT_753117 [Peniophora sp. CONT]